MERAPETAAPAGQAGEDGPPRSRGQLRGVFEVDEDAARASWSRPGLAAVTTASASWSTGMWSAIASSGEVLTGSTPDGLDQQIRAHWQVLQ